MQMEIGGTILWSAQGSLRISRHQGPQVGNQENSNAKVYGYKMGVPSDGMVFLPFGVELFYQGLMFHLFGVSLLYQGFAASKVKKITAWCSCGWGGPYRYVYMQYIYIFVL